MSNYLNKACKERYNKVCSKIKTATHLLRISDSQGQKDYWQEQLDKYIDEKVYWETEHGDVL